MHHLGTPMLPTSHNPMTLFSRWPTHPLIPRLIFLILPVSHRARGYSAKLEGMIDMRVLAGDLSHC